ncbi:MAG: CDP-glycerol glycerophosphotransferase family protein [Methanobrevibacter sp.]|uniref:glycosyltransferase n=1 Tax=Methanobrevibacter sp. TaxID=66852 RepID=UPI0025F3C832|nr:glycosyltransferase [Methanobrevibacter sp.]MBQ6139006.1 CDP-glycerol glycerophosphotransferase family protein [Methanobrevibacter sp.]
MSIKMKLKRKADVYKIASINSAVYRAYDKKVDKNLIYMESRDGNDFTGNILKIAEEISSGKYGNFKIHVFAKKEVHSKIRQLEKNYNFKIDKIISKESLATVTLEKAKYIFTDTGIRPKYIKKPEQILVNTWHGTPLKVMGRDNMPEEHRTGTIQHTFLSADYLIYPNDYMMDKMLNAYMVEKILPGKILLEGYPRNSVFFDEDSKEKFKSKFNFEDKEVFVYMPTYRGTLHKRKDAQQSNQINDYLLELDSKLTDDQVLLVKLHVFNHSQIDFSKFKHVKPFINGYETYDVLNMADVLITDYSSVFFDFANSKRKIIIFNYDEDEYLADREIYFPISDLPFPKVQNIDDLVKELNSPKDYDDSEFVEKFCTYDRPDAAKYICQHIFKGEKVCKEISVENNGKPNILIFAGSLLNNGITSSLLNLLSKIDRDKYNIFFSFRQWDDNIVANHAEIFERIPDDIEYISLRSAINPTIREQHAFDNFLKNGHDPKGTKYPKMIDNMFKREIKRYFYGVNFDKIIHFDGYGSIEMLLFKNFEEPNALWVHNDMVQEIEYKQNQYINVLREVYAKYDNVVVVSDDLIEPTSQLSGRKDNIKVVHNVCDYDEIKSKGEDEIELYKDTTILTTSIYGIKGVLDRPGKKFISIGRFSPEKGHERLLNAFDSYCEDYPDTQLIIIGGYGKHYEPTCDVRRNLKHWENVTLIKWIPNPMPIIKQCDLFILPSHYEGWGLVIMEADIFKLPVVATDVVGVQWLKDVNGNVYEDSEEGILQGLYDFHDNKLSLLDVDYEEYNKHAVDEFYEILDGD